MKRFQIKQDWKYDSRLALKDTDLPSSSAVCPFVSSASSFEGKGVSSEEVLWLLLACWSSDDDPWLPVPAEAEVRAEKTGSLSVILSAAATGARLT